MSGAAADEPTGPPGPTGVDASKLSEHALSTHPSDVSMLSGRAPGHGREALTADRMIDDAAISEPDSGNDKVKPTACLHEGKDADGVELISSDEEEGFVEDSEVVAIQSDPDHSKSYRSVTMVATTGSTQGCSSSSSSSGC